MLFNLLQLQKTSKYLFGLLQKFKGGKYGRGLFTYSIAHLLPNRLQDFLFEAGDFLAIETRLAEYAANRLQELRLDTNTLSMGCAVRKASTKSGRPATLRWRALERPRNVGNKHIE